MIGELLSHSNRTVAAHALPSLRRSFRPPLLVGFPEGYQVLHAPQPISDARGHRRRRSQRAVNLPVVSSDSLPVIIQSQ
jgi:hypothetical protein